ncbi:type IX secretion system membrane protein PorP/SprF [Aquimarina sp. W85]|uniref:PorP/SprF family type IX secretion system membrane protein n=1 Tax=Aquimarina rhodophyticola TaxID=3342246 RepID=UPI00366C0F0C
MNKLLLFLILISIMYTSKSYTQQDSQYTQYMYNTININSAYTGSRGVLSVLGLYRTQWVGLDGAPSTQTLAIHSPINQKNKIGIGLSIINDNAGPSQETSFNANFSYTLKLSKKGRFSFGLNAGGNLLNVDLVSLRKYNDNDQLLLQDVDRRFSPGVGLGLYYRNDNFYMGLSAPNVLETEHFDSSSLSDNSLETSFLASERINYYFITGYVFEVAPLIKLKPAALIKYVQGTPWQFDISANMLFYEKFTLGASYRFSEAVSALAGFQISESLMIGLSYDREISELGKSEFNKGSFEFLLRFELKRVFSKGLTPRFF